MIKTYRFVYKSPKNNWGHTVIISEEKMKKALYEASIKKYPTSFDFLAELGYASIIASEHLIRVEEINDDTTETVCTFYQLSFKPTEKPAVSETGFLSSAVETIKKNNIQKLHITKVSDKDTYILMYTHNQVALAMLDSNLGVKVTTYPKMLTLLINAFPEYLVSANNSEITLEKRKSILDSIKVARINEQINGWTISGHVSDNLEDTLNKMRDIPEFISKMGHPLKINPNTEVIGVEGDTLIFNTLQHAIDFIEDKVPSIIDVLINRLTITSKLNLCSIEQDNIQSISVRRGHQMNSSEDSTVSVKRVYPIKLDNLLADELISPIGWLLEDNKFTKTIGAVTVNISKSPEDSSTGVLNIEGVEKISGEIEFQCGRWESKATTLIDLLHYGIRELRELISCTDGLGFELKTAGKLYIE